MSRFDHIAPDLLFKQLERATPEDSLPAASTLLAAVRFNTEGLLPAIAQQHDTQEVLMMAWMNREALEETLTTQRVCYYSRSRKKLWRKGESSGQQQQLVSAALDCDGDTLLLQVDQTGPACHTGRRSCFYIAVDQEQASITSAPLIDPDELYGKKPSSRYATLSQDANHSCPALRPAVAIDESDDWLRKSLSIYP